jgi:integrase
MVTRCQNRQKSLPAVCPNWVETVQRNDLDLVNARIKLPRRKTGINRDSPLWPETIKSLQKIPKKGGFVFYTNRGNPYIQTFVKTDVNGNEKCTTLNLITTKFSRLIRKVGLNVPKGTGFYSLRRTAATIAARSGNPFAVQEAPWPCRFSNGNKICSRCFCSDRHGYRK